MANGLSGKGNRPGLSRISGVRSELARIYRLAKTGKLDTSEATKLAYILKEIRCCLEVESLQRIEENMHVAVTDAVERAISRRQIETGEGMRLQ